MEGRVGQGLGVVTRGPAHHAASALLGAQPQQGVGRAAELEGPDPLQVLALEEHPRADALVDLLAAVQGRTLDAARQALGGRGDLGCAGGVGGERVAHERLIRKVATWAKKGRSTASASAGS